LVLKGDTLAASEGSRRVIVAFMQEIARHAMFGRHSLDTLDRAKEGWTAVVYRELEDEAEESKVLPGIAKPRSLPCVEIRRPI
jgi:hypothetical protein